MMKRWLLYYSVIDPISLTSFESYVNLCYLKTWFFTAAFGFDMADFFSKASVIIIIIILIVIIIIIY